MPEKTEGSHLTITICTSQPIELMDLTNSFMAIADEYKRHVAQGGYVPLPDEVKLYVKEIRSGSIVADLIAIAPGILDVVAYTVTLTEFCRYLKIAFDYLTGHSKQDPGLERVNYQNLINILEPVTKDQSGQLNCETFVNNGLVVNVNLDSTEANAAQNKAQKYIDSLNEKVTGLHSNVVLYWYQARNDLRTKAGDKAIIESISPNPVKAKFAKDDLKKRMILGDENPFGVAYIVDVMVETVSGKPAVFNIIDFYEKIEKPK